MLIQWRLGIEAPFGNYKLTEKAPITLCFIDTDFIETLEKFGIPVQSDLPFSYNWHGLIGKLGSQEKTRAARWIANLVYEEWNLVYWRFMMEKQGWFENLDFRSIVEPAMDKVISKENRGHSGVMGFDLDSKWWLDLLAIKLRSVWDKLPHAIAESSDLELSGKSFPKRLNKLAELKDKLGLPVRGKKLLSKLIEEAGNIEKIKDHRDGEAHGHTKRYAEIFGLPEQETLGEAWAYLKPELNCCREANLATIGLILAGNGIINY